VWHDPLHAGEVAAQMVNCGFELRAEIIGVMPHFVMGRRHYHWAHQPCYYFVRKGKSARWTGDRSQSTVWDVSNLNPFGGDREETATGHGTQKPVELMRRPILNHGTRGDVIYDPFLGSGTTLIAAELTKRVCCGIELAPEYVDLILRRWQELTGRKAVLADSDKTFDQVEAERALLAQPKPEGD
jgi:DNA modification methylase